jgi:hypothetical protein
MKTPRGMKMTRKAETPNNARRYKSKKIRELSLEPDRFA